MRHLKMVGLSLVAVFAIAAIAATSASALPEWGKCVKIGEKGGRWTGPNCTVNPEVPEGKAKKNSAGEFLGEYEWKKGKELANVHFTGHNEGSGGVLISKFRGCFSNETGELEGRVTRAHCAETGTEENFEEAIEIECETETNSGEASGTNKVVNVNVKFTGCKVFGSAPCSNGTGEGEIQVNPLKGNLGYISKPEKKVGVLLTPAKAKGEFAKFNCAGILETVVGVGNAKEGAYYEPEKTGGYDGIISPITPINQMTNEYTQVYTVNKEAAANIPSKFEGKHIELLEDYLYNPEQPQVTEMWSRAGEEITNVNTPAEEGEIKA